MKFYVSEIFGPTIQGEGPSIGKPCCFLRLALCNQKCVFCDSFFTWAFRKEDVENHLYVKEPSIAKNEVTGMTEEEIINQFVNLNPTLLIVSGGEPFLQHRKLEGLLVSLMNEVDNLGKIEIETAGTLTNPNILAYPFVYFNVSPKLENSGNAKSLRYQPEILKGFRDTERAIFKFVVSNDSDMEEVDQIVKVLKLPPNLVYIMVEGITKEDQEERMREFVPKTIDRGYVLTPRLHTLLWGNKRGV